MWKNFTNGMMDHWLSESYAKETLDLDKTYDFLQGFSNMNASTFTMREAFDVGLENLYMGFNYHILNDNEETLHADLMKTIAQYGEDFVKMIGADTALHHAFVYKGMAYRTGVHQAPASDWFFQIGNGKSPVGAYLSAEETRRSSRAGTSSAPRASGASSSPSTRPTCAPTRPTASARCPRTTTSPTTSACPTSTSTRTRAT